MPIPTTITDLSTTIASNSPAGSDPPSQGDDYIRALSAFVRQTYDADLLKVSAATLADTASIGNGDALLGVKKTTTGAVASTQHEVNERTVHLFDFCSAAQIADWKSGALVQDFTTPLQSLIDACSSNTQGGAPEGILPAGKGKVTGKLRLKQEFINLSGAGMWQTWIVYNGVATGCLVADAIAQLVPTFKDFSITGNSTSGHAIDTSAVTVNVTGGEMRNMIIWAGAKAIYMLNAFYFTWHGIIANSITDHVFHIDMGNTTVMERCYAGTVPAGKAGYRLTGGIRLRECNGVDSGGIWGIFGNKLTATDGWQGDFSFNDYPSVDLQGCNLEAFGIAGIILHQGYRSFSMTGCKISRTAGTDYHSCIWATTVSLASGPLQVGLWRFDLGAGQAKGGTFAAGVWTAGALTNAQMYANADYFEDLNGQLTNNLTAYGFVAKSYSDASASLVPILTKLAVSDVSGDDAFSFSAITSRRITQQMVMYKTTNLTPVGAGQAIDVTGYTKVTVTPAAAASITTATFTATSGAGLDAGRNGDLLIEAGNANLTINHTALGGAANTFVLSGGANLAVGNGGIVRFCRSVTKSQWVQV